MNEKIAAPIVAQLILLMLTLSVLSCQANGKSEKAEMNRQKGESQMEYKYTNHLISEKSPYLLQHAHNPVDWYPWGEEAFAKARKENKPIFLSIGYSTCHWCHVMERESFSDPEVARLLNKAFVCIKVDREERPDIDDVYMTVAQMMTGSGGWPLTIIMTPDKKPFFAGTYIPKHNRFGREGLMELIPKVEDVWKNRRADVLSSAEQITQALQKANHTVSGVELGPEILKTTYELLAKNYDAEHGGFGSAPKFPSPHNLLFLLRYWKRSGDPHALEMVETTLQKMRMGGVFDQIGFGFHRYSTDPEWLVPHFEKMLYDQAMLAMAYTEAYQATGKSVYRTTAEEIFTYVLRDMTSPEGAFYSAEDADSEGKEGKFYLWTDEEIKSVLGAKDARLFNTVYNVSAEGNFSEITTRQKTGENILHLTKSLAENARELKMSEADLAKKLETWRQKLFDVREKRVHPFKDDKVLTDWNGLMIAALAKAARTFDEPKYALAAEKAVHFIQKELTNGDGSLEHRFRGGQAGLNAHLDDYAFLSWGLIELYETTFKVDYLKRALALTGILKQHFWDNKQGGFYFTADNAEALLVRKKEIYDGAIPSGNSVEMWNLLRLSRMTGNTEFADLADRLTRPFAAAVKRYPAGYSMLMAAYDFAEGPSFEIVIVGQPDAADARKMLTVLRREYIPNKVVLFRHAENKTVLEKISPFTAPMSAINNRATVYVCRNFRCELPTTEIPQMLRMLNKSS